MNTQAYLVQLKLKYDRLTDEYERAVFYTVCKAYQDVVRKLRKSKYVTKEEMLRYLSRKGLITEKEAQATDPRRLRDVCRDLLKRGYPIIATSKTHGYFVPESEDEIDLAKGENRSRGKSVFDADKGYERIRQLLLGQQDFLGIV